MVRYINAENMYKEVWKRSTSPLNEWDTWGVLNVLDMVKTEDVEPVIHAHWIEHQLSEYGEYEFCCSNCEHTNYGYDNPGNYCPYCGAKMDEEVE